MSTKKKQGEKEDRGKGGKKEKYNKNNQYSQMEKENNKIKASFMVRK